MPRGGRRHGRSAAAHAGLAERPQIEPTNPPRPPKDMPAGPERDAWLEVARQVAILRTYDPTRYSAFRLCVKALAAVYTMPADLKASQARGLMENASRLLGRFGLDPVASRTVEVPPEPPDPDEEDEFAEFDDVDDPAAAAARRRRGIRSVLR